jgi:hypothetical protein
MPRLDVADFRGSCDEERAVSHQLEELETKRLQLGRS